jgi:hypothetical protein
MAIIGDIIRMYERILDDMGYILPMLVGDNDDFILMLFESDTSDELFNMIEPVLEIAAEKGIFVRQFRPWLISVLTELIKGIHDLHSQHNG